MSITSKILLVTACLLQAGVFATQFARPAYGSGFTAFAEDEDVCRRVGATAIDGATGASASQRYDVAYRRCMATHGRMRQRGGYPQGVAPGAGYSAGNPHSFEYPDAFYSVPYATPGYGYDGFSN